MGYERMDHAGWVESNNRSRNKMHAKRKGFRPAPEALTPFQARVMDICGIVGGGIYNAPISWDKVAWGDRYEGDALFITWRDDRFATWDFGALTMLVLLAHEARIRIEIRAKTKGYFELVFSQRQHEGGIARRHPSIDEAVAAFRAYLPADHRVVYRAPVEPAEAA